MTSTIEGYRPPAQHERVEQGKHRRESFFSKIGRFVRQELGFQSPEVRRASDTLRAHAAQLQKEVPHLDAKNPDWGSRKRPDAMQGDPSAEYRPPVAVNTTADRVDLGHAPSAGEHLLAVQNKPFTVEGQVTSVEDAPLPPKELEPTSEDYFAPRMSGTLPTEIELHNAPVGSEDWHIARETPTPQPQHEVSIGTNAWHKAQEEKPILNPHEVSIGENRWAKGDEAKAIVQEQQVRIQEQAARAKAEAENHSGDEVWQARQARRERLLRIRAQNSVNPGEYKPDVIERSDENDQDHKAA